MAFKPPKAFNRLTTSARKLRPRLDPPKINQLDAQSANFANIKLPPMKQQPPRSMDAPTDRGEARTRRESMQRDARVLVGGEGMSFGDARFPSPPGASTERLRAAANQGMARAQQQPRPELEATAATLPAPRSITDTLDAEAQYAADAAQYGEADAQRATAQRQAAQQQQQAQAPADSEVGTSQSGLFAEGQVDSLAEEQAAREQKEESWELYLDALKRGDNAKAQEHLKDYFDAKAAETRARTTTKVMTQTGATEEVARERSQEITDKAKSENLADDMVDSLWDGGFWENERLTDKGKRIDFDEDPDNTKRGEGHVQISFDGGKKFDATNPDEFPPEFNEYLAELGIDPEDFAAKNRTRWLDRYYPNRSPEQDAALRAAMEVGEANGVFLDDENGLVDSNGNPLPFTWNQIVEAAEDPDHPLYQDARAKPLIEHVQNSLQGAVVGGREVGAVAGEQADSIDFDQKAEEFIEESDEEFAQTIQALDEGVENTITNLRQAASADKAKNLRVAMNRLGRAGSSPEAIAGTSAQVSQQYDAALLQQETAVRFQAEMQKFQAAVNKLNRDAEIWLQMQQLAANKEQQEFAIKMHNYAIQQAQQYEQRMLAKQNEFNFGQFAAQLGVAGVGTLAGTLTGGVGAIGVAGLAQATGVANTLYGQQQQAPRQPAQIGAPVGGGR